ncbi:40s ribosomal protein s4, partial [Quercus suber]
MHMACHLTLFAASPAIEFAANPSPKKKRGCVGVIKKGEKHKGSFETTHIQDAVGNVFETHQSNVFTIVDGTEPWVSLPKDSASSCPSLKRQGGDGKLKRLL